MKIKKYLVGNMNEALTRIRYELGQNAVIISQRKVRKKGMAGFFSPKLLEVTAAIEEKSFDDSRDSLEAVKTLLGKGIKEAKVEKRNEEKPVAANNLEIIKEVHEMKALINSLINKGNLNTMKDNSDTLEKLLLSNDLEENVVNYLKSKIPQELSNEEKLELLHDILEDEIDIFEETTSKVMILVGPTGVGKTTTIAKLAGRFALIEKKKVGLITIDTYRIGAVEQLKTYSEIMNIPFKVVFNMADMDKALADLDYCDTILIDTTGRSSKNPMQISELRAYLHKVATDSIYLVISGTTKNKDIEAIVEGYRPLNYNSIIITKLDETSSYGSIINVTKAANAPIAYIATGQNVPDDIKVPTKSQLINLILGEEKIC